MNSYRITYKQEAAKVAANWERNPHQHLFKTVQTADPRKQGTPIPPRTQERELVLDPIELMEAMKSSEWIRAKFQEARNK